MRPEEVTGLGRLAADAAGSIALQVRELHEGIARRVFRAVGVGAAPVQVVHDQIAERAHDAARGLTTAIVRGGARAVSVARPPDASGIDESLRGRLALGALNGALGDHLHRDGNALTLGMTLRRGGRDIDAAEADLSVAYPDATPRIAVFLHGLCETDEAWKIGAQRHIPYGARLHAELGYTPLYVRYNTGRHISENGREFADLLDAVAERWPVEIQEIALIGHSMGGLVSRSACHYADGSTWPSKVRHVFTLGAPHKGAPLEKAATAATGALSRLPETRGLARALKARSSGIKDLGHGYLVDEDWLDQDPDAFVQQAGSVIPFLSCATHYFICATVTREADAPVGRLVGDLLVLRESAWGQARRGERMQFPVEQYSHVGDCNHFELLNHPAIYEQIRRWLTGRPALPAPRRELPPVSFAPEHELLG
ncbi:MAG: esterase/lipase family protein [Solirubrobacteraceae bacterium]